MADGQMNIRVNVDLNDMRRKAEEYRKEVTKMGVITDESGNVISTAWMRMKQAATAYLGMDIVKRIAMTRGEFQQLEVAFKTLLGAEEPALNLMNQLVETAATTPFDLKGVADGARQLLAYGFAADEINDTLIRLGNVAAGLGLPLERLTYLYGTTAVQGRLYARDMLQFQSSGIPVLQELSKMYGKTTSEINDMVTAGKIGFDDIKKVFEGMTNEGGKFYALMEGQSKTIIGQISNLGDAIDMMFNEIGQANEGIISDAISGASYLVENYEKILKILKVLIATYGAYKASLIAVAAAQKLSITIQNISAWLSLAKTIRTARDAQIAFNLATKANPYVLLATAIIGVGTALYQFTKKTDTAKDALKKFNDEADRQSEKYKNLISTAQDDSKAIFARQQALEELRKIYPSIFSEMDLEAIKTTDQIKLTNELTKAERERQKQQSGTNIEYLEKNISSVKKDIDFLNKNAVADRTSRSIKANKRLEELQDLLKGEQAIYKKITSEIKAQEEAEKRAAEERKKREESQKKTVAWYEQEIKALKDAQESSTTKAEYQDYQKQIDKLEKAKNIITGELSERQKAERKAAEERKKVLEKINDELLALERENQQSRIDLMEEGREKELAQIRKDYKDKIAEIKKQADKWAEEQGGTLTVKQTVEITTAYNNAKKGKAASEKKLLEDEVKAEREAMQEYIKEYGTYQEKRLIIAKQYAEKIAAAQTIGEKMSLEEERDKAIQDLDQSMIEQTDFWTRLFSDANEHTNKYISQIIADTEKLIDYINDKTGDVKLPDFITKEQAESIKKNGDKIKDILEELKKKKDALKERNPFVGIINGFKDLFNAGGDAEKQMAAINDIIGNMNGAATIINQVGDALNDMGIKAGGALNDIANVVGETMSMTQTGASLGGPIGAAVGAAIGLATSLTKLFMAKHDAKRDKRIAQLQEQIDEIDKENAKLEKTADKQYGESKKKSLEEENANIEKQNALIEQQIAEERDKKKTDQGKIDEYNRQLEANREKIEENKEAALDAIMGEDIKSAIERFADAYAEAWAKNEDSAEHAKNAVKKQMQQMVKTAIQNYIEASGKMAEIRAKMDEYFADGVFTGAEQEALYRMADELDREIEQKFGANKGLFQEDSEEALKRQTGTISETITEKTANESMGIWRGSYDTLKSISQQTTMFHETYKSTMATCNSILNTIARNTGQTADNTSVLSEVRDTLNRVDGRLQTIESGSSKRYAR